MGIAKLSLVVLLLCSSPLIAQESDKSPHSPEPKKIDQTGIEYVRMEHALLHWSAGEYAQLLETVSGFPEKSNGAVEVEYYRGLAQYHLGEVGTARLIWKQLIKSSSEGPWIYLADWAYCESGRGESLLGRIAYGCQASRFGSALIGRNRVRSTGPLRTGFSR